VAVTTYYRFGSAAGRLRLRTVTAETDTGQMSGSATSAGSFVGAYESSGTDGVTYALNSATEYEAVIVGDFPSAHGLHVDHTHPPRWFGAADIVAVADGAWSDNATWDLGRPPAAGEIVHVPTKLTIQTGGTRKIVAQLLAVNDNGELVADFSGVADPTTDTFEVVIPDTAIDTVADYLQFGNGILAVGSGKVTVKGKAKTTWGRLAAEVAAATDTITLAEAPTGWQVGDRVVLQDSRMVKWELYLPEWEPGHLDNHQYEERVVESVAGAVVTVTAPWTYAHGGAKDKDGAIDFYPAVMNLTRNVKVYSENAEGTRGHCLFHGRVALDWQYVELKDMGRSKQAAWNNAVGTTAGSNQQGRYALHCHHLIGPAGLAAGVPQFTVKGGAVWNDSASAWSARSRWSYTVHASHYGLVEDCVSFAIPGAGFVHEDGSETENTMNRNCHFLAPFSGTGENSRSPNDIAHAGQGFWAGSGESRWTDNFASGCDTGFAIVPYMTLDPTNVRRPAYKGADPFSGDPADYVTTDVQHRPLLEFSGNEVGAHCDIGMTLWQIGSTGFATYSDQAESVVLNHKVWHVAHSHYYNYMTRNVTFRNLIARNDFTKLRAGQGKGTAFFTSDYVQEDILIDQCDIQGFVTGWLVNFGNTQACTDTLWCNYADIFVRPTFGAGTTAENIPPRALTFTDCTFPDPTCSFFDNYQILDRKPFVMDGRIPAFSANLIHDDVIQSINHNGTTDDYRILYLEQLGSAVLEQTQTTDITTVLGSPEAGKTNTQNLADNGVCFADYIPSAPATHADVYGRVETI
jgi:hypothetical protein